MPRSKLPLLTLPLCLAATVLLINIEKRSGEEGPLHSTANPGGAVEQAYRAHIDRLRVYYASLAAMLRANAPELLPMLEPPQLLAHGYGMLPRISGAPPAARRSARAQSAGYSWPWTNRLIDSQLAKIDQAERELEGASGQSADVRRNVYEKLARSYPQLREAEYHIDAHIEYNRLWQAAIAGDRPAYDRQTLLYETALERQAILDALALDNPSRQRSFSVLDKRLKRRAELLARDIEAATAVVTTPDYVRVEHRDPGVRAVVLPIYTDIDDQEFVQRLKREVENIWRVRDGDNEFRVELVLWPVTVAELYTGDGRPRTGDSIDIRTHVARFPSDGAILTTGGATTHVYGRALVLGPHAISARVIAHEIGHLLGFKDSYFRGYRDLEEDGFEVLEVVASPEDIMGTPEGGAVTRGHFDRIFAHAASAARPAKLLSP